MKLVSFAAIISIILPIAAGTASAAPDAFSVIHSRKSVRNFTGKPVSKTDLEKIMKAGMAAPTAMNKQPWAFIAVSERKTLDKLSEGLPYAKMLGKAGAAIIVCAVPEKAAGGIPEFAVIDCSLASENILLAVEAMGLGAVFTAAYPDKDRMALIRNALNIPDNIIPLNVIPIGYPTGEDKPKDKFKKENIHWEKW